MKQKMKQKMIVIALAVTFLNACSDEPARQVQYVQQPPVQQYAPQAAAPVIVQSAPANNGSDAVLGLAAGAALGAVAANAMNNNSRDNYNYSAPRHYDSPRTTNNTTIVKKTIVINQAAAAPAPQVQQAKPSYSQPSVSPNKVQLAKSPVTSYKSPTVSMSVKSSSSSSGYSGKR